MAQVAALDTPLAWHTKHAAVVETAEVSPTLTSPRSETAAPRTISELISSRASTTGNQPILGYPVQGTEYVEYTFQQIDDFTDNGANYLAQQIPLRLSSTARESVVALLGQSSLEYFITATALSRLGFTVLFLSTRISEAAYVSLMKSTSCAHVCVDAAFSKTAAGVKSHLPHLCVHSILDRSQYEAKGHDTFVVDRQQQQLDPSEESTKISWIIHSSGSTGMPKPIYQTHVAALRNYDSNMNMEGFITLPLFHAHGLSSVLRGFASCKKIFMYSASLPLTSQTLLEILGRYPFEIFYGVPYALKLLSESETGIRMLARMRIVMFGGSACPDGLGDTLVQNGVNLISHYGTTETGQLMTSFRPVGDPDWNYVRVHDALGPFIRFEPRGGNLFELVVLKGWPSLVTSNRDDGSYATKDLFEPHAGTRGAWKYGGRLDDTIVLTNGEKAIPIIMEMSIRQNHLVKDAVVVGNGKAQLGMIIIPSDKTSASLRPDVLVNELWPVIQSENKTSPAYAQITQESVVVLPAGTMYPQTDKGTLIRQAFYKAFAQQIEELYQRLEASSTGTRLLNNCELRQYLKDQITKLSPDFENAEDDTDLFSLGIDSLQSSRLRGTIIQEIQLHGNKLSQNVVFEHPSINKLANAIIAARDGVSTTANALSVEEEMSKLITKYGDFPQHVSVKSSSSARKTVVVTGATGSLGAHIVAQLAARDDISEICCLVRASSPQNAMARTLKSMNDRAVLHSLTLGARRKITACPSDFARVDLGLDDATHRHLRSSMVSLVHCAWSVNFNKRLSSFEADCIAGAKHLMLLCLAVERPTPASFHFCSSVSTVARTPGLVIPEALPEALNHAQGMGYAQSKLVTEHLVDRAAKQTGMVARVLRVGQIVADTTHGIWNDTEAIPLMLQAATTIGVLPVLDESPRWLPVDVVARSVNDIALSEHNDTFFNIVNPNSFHWTRDLLPMLEEAGLSFEGVSQREWIQRLRTSDPDVSVNPTYKLLEFFSAKYDHDRGTKKDSRYVTQNVERTSASIRSIPALTQALVSKFVTNFLATSWRPKQRASGPKLADEQTSKTKPAVELLILAGPCGTGKSTFAAMLAHKLSYSAIEGDSLHDAVAITKMSAGLALSSLDREIWLARVKIAVLERIRAAEVLNVTPPARIILTCSALRREYRDALRRLVADDSLQTRFVMLDADEEELVRRVDGRLGHYMKSRMVKSQLEVYERPTVEERDVLPVDTESGGVETLVEQCCDVLGLE